MATILADRAMVTDHLTRLHAHHAYAFEVRCLGHRVESRQFWAHEIDRAVDYALAQNRAGLNIYATPNPLRVAGSGSACDADIACAYFHYADADEAEFDTLVGRIAELPFPLSYTVITGTVPKPRAHFYWRLAQPQDNLVAWRNMQRRIAAHLGTDITVCNPSRVMRVGGTVSYPPRRKINRGYVQECGAIGLEPDVPINNEEFFAAFPPEPVERPAGEERPRLHVVPKAEPCAGDVPTCVVEAALDAIPPISQRGQGDRNRWLAIAYACKDCGAHARYAFEAWQARSPLYRREDDRVWDTLRPTPGSYVALFGAARAGNTDWWRVDPVVEDWWRAQASRYYREGVDALTRYRGRVLYGAAQQWVGRKSARDDQDDDEFDDED